MSAHWVLKHKQLLFWSGKKTINNPRSHTLLVDTSKREHYHKEIKKIPLHPGAATTSWWTRSLRWSTVSPRLAPRSTSARWLSLSAAGKTCLSSFRRIFRAQNMWYVSIFQAHQDILSCSRSGLNACFSPAEVQHDQTSSPPPMLQNESDLSGILAPNIKVEAILTVQKAELRTATETVNTVICSNNIS